MDSRGSCVSDSRNRSVCECWFYCWLALRLRLLLLLIKVNVSVELRCSRERENIHNKTLSSANVLSLTHTHFAGTRHSNGLIYHQRQIKMSINLNCSTKQQSNCLRCEWVCVCLMMLDAKKVFVVRVIWLIVPIKRDLHNLCVEFKAPSHPVCVCASVCDKFCSIHTRAICWCLMFRPFAQSDCKTIYYELENGRSLTFLCLWSHSH